MVHKNLLVQLKLSKDSDNIEKYIAIFGLVINNEKFSFRNLESVLKRHRCRVGPCRVAIILYVLQ